MRYLPHDFNALFILCQLYSYAVKHGGKYPLWVFKTVSVYEKPSSVVVLSKN